MAASVCIVLPQPAQITSKFHDTIYEEYSAPKADFLDLLYVLVHNGDSKIKVVFFVPNHFVWPFCTGHFCITGYGMIGNSGESRKFLWNQSLEMLQNLGMKSLGMLQNLGNSQKSCQKYPKWTSQISQNHGFEQNSSQPKRKRFRLWPTLSIYAASVSVWVKSRRN